MSHWKPSILVSFAAITKPLRRWLDANRDRVGATLLDSGAYSVWRSGKTVDLAEYQRFIDGANGVFDTYVQLDVIRDPEATLANYRRMRDAGYAPLPVLQMGAPAQHLAAFAGDTDYVGLGGLVNHGRNLRARQWLRYVREMPHGAATDFHLFGMSSPRNDIAALAPRSCDSSTLHVRLGRRDWPVLDTAGSNVLTRAVEATERSHTPPLKPGDLRRSFAYAGLPYTDDRGNDLRRELILRCYVRYAHDLEATVGTRLHFVTTSPRFTSLLADTAERLRGDGVIADG